MASTQNNSQHQTPPSFAELFEIALMKALSSQYREDNDYSEISERLGQYSSIKVKKGKLPKLSKKDYNSFSAFSEIISQWMQHLNLITYVKYEKILINKELISSLLERGVTFQNIKNLPNYNNFINLFSFYYALNQYDHSFHSFCDGIYIELEQALNKELYGENGDPTLNEFIKEIQSRLDFNLNYYDRFGYIPNLTKESLSVLNEIDISTEILRLSELINNKRSNTIIEELDHNFQLIRQDAPHHLNNSNFNYHLFDQQQPTEQIEQDTLETKILNRIKKLSPTQFEHFSIDFIKRIMGKENVISIHNGQVGDGGIDGIVKIKKPLGNNYEEYYIQCKRYDKTSIGRPELQSFIGAMAGHNAKNGVFITTSSFTKQGAEFIKKLSQHEIILIDGNKLVKDIIDRKIGIKEVQQEPILDIDEDFFNKFKD